MTPCGAPLNFWELESINQKCYQTLKKICLKNIKYWPNRTVKRLPMITFIVLTFYVAVGVAHACNVHCGLGHQTVGAHPLPAQSSVHAVKGWSVVEFQGHSLNKWVSYMSAWVPAAGLGGGSRATPSVSTILPVQSESAQVPLFPRPFSLAAQQYEWGRVIFLNSSLSPNCYWEG